MTTTAVLPPRLFDRLRHATAGYPRSFWILFWGMLVQNVGISMVWPFLTIYIRQRLSVPLTAVTLLFTLNSLTGLASTSLAGPIVDRFGRKGVMVVGLVASSVAQVMMSIAGTLPLWGIVMAVSGAVSLLCRAGAGGRGAVLCTRRG